LNHFKEVDIADKVHINNKLCEIAYPDMTSLGTPKSQVKTKMTEKGLGKKICKIN